MAAAVAIAPYELVLKAASALVSSASDPRAQSRTVPTTLPLGAVITELTVAFSAVGTVAGTRRPPSATPETRPEEVAHVSS